jgi:BirA family biotin operon repressor/biotin-[acetyl-CoA-carboxylase] ligase
MRSNETDSPKATEKDQADRRGEYLTKSLESKGFGPILWVEETGSTNVDLLKISSSSDIEGMVIIADFQNSGRGRRDRRWESEPNSALLMSVGFQADTKSVNLGVFASGVAVAACVALSSFGFEQIRIKWPNDIVVVGCEGDEQPKLAGVLAQSQLVDTRASVVVGIGINVNPSNLREVVPERRVISLSDLRSPPDRVDLAEIILENLAAIDLESSKFWDFYRSLSATIGQDIRVITDNEVLEGVAQNVTNSGSLIVLDENGVSREVTSGDLVSMRPL